MQIDSSTNSGAPHGRACYTLKEAAKVLGYDNPNTVRNKHLKTPDALGRDYDDRGRVILSKAAVDSLAQELAKERRDRGPWRVKNLGRYNGDLRLHRGKKKPRSDS